ncbi:hypothetical protein C0989_002600 [Termitomyces sp. Mn162]|nr:hypothetical protein C0989_002600 [Termitomyces sp. Mn162]
MTSILASTALTTKNIKLKNTVIAVAFLLEADIADSISATLAEAVASKTLRKLKGLVNKISSSAKFLSANDTQCAESTLALKAMSDTLEGVSSLLDALATKLVSPSTAPNSSSTWATMASMALAGSPTPLPHQATLSSLLSVQEMLSVQQCQLQNACTVLVKF